MNISVTPARRATTAALTGSTEEAGLFWSLQYCRASTLSLTRLELALESGDRQRIVEAIDRLHALDGEIERKVAALPKPAGPDPDRDAINDYLNREKMAVAFEKLVLASGISGPRLASSPAYMAEKEPLEQSTSPVETIDSEPPFAAKPKGIIATYGPKIALLLGIAVATGGILTLAL